MSVYTSPSGAQVGPDNKSGATANVSDGVFSRTKIIRSAAIVVISTFP
jgi:hypothetical protein